MASFLDAFIIKDSFYTMFLGKCETSLQSASSWAKNGRSYVFKGVHYWMLSDATKKAEKDYPKNINEGWGGVPDNIDDSLLWSNNRLYFFKV